MKFYSKVVTSLYFLSKLVLLSVLFLILSDVLIRLTEVKPWTYTMSLVEYGLLWFCVLAAPKLMEENSHITIDIFKTQNQIHRIVINLICLLVCGSFTLFSLNVLVDSVLNNRLDIRAEELPMWFLIWPLPLSFGLITFHFFTKILRFF